MNKKHLPNTDSIEELARFWDEHDLMDFEDELEEVREPVFLREPKGTIPLHLSQQELDQLQQMAEQRGVDAATLVHEWVTDKLQSA